MSFLLFSARIKGNQHLQGNVQVYNVRIPVESLTAALGIFLQKRGVQLAQAKDAVE